jgi:hypothetical protein
MTNGIDGTVGKWQQVGRHEHEEMRPLLKWLSEYL